MCPLCQSRFLLIKQRTGFERLKIAIPAKRTYECLDCHKVFRIKDRRRFDRREDPDWGPTFAAAANAMNTDHALQFRIPFSVQLAMVAGGAVGLYVAPSLVEQVCVPFFGPWFSVVLLGDLAGCMAVAWLSNRLNAAGLYLMLAICKAFMIRTGLLTIHELVWLSDTIPATFSCVMILKSSESKFAEAPEPPAEY
jgi:hypothetical protein